MLRRRLEALERKSQGAERNNAQVIIFEAMGEGPAFAWVVIAGQYQTVERNEGESAEAFTARCEAMAGK